MTRFSAGIELCYAVADSIEPRMQEIGYKRCSESRARYYGRSMKGRVGCFHNVVQVGHEVFVAYSQTMIFTIPFSDPDCFQKLKWLYWYEDFREYDGSK